MSPFRENKRIKKKKEKKREIKVLISNYDEQLPRCLYQEEILEFDYLRCPQPHCFSGPVRSNHVQPRSRKDKESILSSLPSVLSLSFLLLNKNHSKLSTISWYKRADIKDKNFSYERDVRKIIPTLHKVGLL